MYDFEIMLNNCGIQQLSLDNAKTILEKAALYYHPQISKSTKKKINSELKANNRNEFGVYGVETFIVIDKDGIINKDVFLRERLKEAHFNYQIFNLNDFSTSFSSNRYNPLWIHHFHSDSDIIQFASYMVDVLMEHTSSDIYFTGGKPFNWNLRQGNLYWNKAMKTLLTAYIAYLHEDAPPEECTLHTLIELIKANRRPEYDEEYVTSVDILFEKHEAAMTAKSCDSLSIKQYNLFKNSSSYYKNCINDYLGYLLSPFDNNDIKELTSSDFDYRVNLCNEDDLKDYNDIDVEYDTLSIEEKFKICFTQPNEVINFNRFGHLGFAEILFVTVPSYDDTYMPLLKMLLYQLIKHVMTTKNGIAQQDINITLFK